MSTLLYIALGSSASESGLIAQNYGAI